MRPFFLIGALGDKEDGGEKATEEGEDPEVAEARREMEEKRKEKHRKMEVEREEMRQQIRDKVFCSFSLPFPSSLFLLHSLYSLVDHVAFGPCW